MNNQIGKFFRLGEIQDERSKAGNRYLEFLRVPAMSAGVYVLPPGAADPQSPHKEDELYYVVRGWARMQVGSGGQADDQVVTQGSVIFVAANVEHRFHDIAEELVVLVFFAPAETR